MPLLQQQVGEITEITRQWWPRPEDLRRHEVACRGSRHPCPRCGQGFRSRAGLDRHSVWGEGCGALGQGREGRAVRLDLGKVAVVGVGCEDLLDEQVFTQAARKRR